MTLKPIRDRILIKPEDKESVTASGIVIPDNAAEKPLKGKVLAVGTGKLNEDGTIVPLVIKEGDTVLVWWRKATKVKDDDQEYYIVDEEFISMIYDFGD